MGDMYSGDFMELSELASRIGVKSIIISSINNDYLKDHFTVIVNDDILVDLMGKTYTFIPLSSNGVGKQLSTASVRKIFDLIREEMKGKTV